MAHESRPTGEFEHAGVVCEVNLHCAVCSATGVIVHSDLQDLIFDVPGHWGLRRCTNKRCGLVWLDPTPLPEETFKFYGAYYTHLAETSNADGPGFRRADWKSLLRRALALILFWRRHAFQSGLSYLEGMPCGRMLEVGCGNGRFLHAATIAGWRAVGIDFDPAAVSAASKIPGVEAFPGDLRTVKFKDGGFDAIVMNNVIEHLPQPTSVLKECQRILRPGGRLVLVTPNTRSLGYRHYGQDWRGLEIPRHLFLYSPATLTALARAAQFANMTTFSTAGGHSGVEMLTFSQALRDKRLKRGRTVDEAAARRIIREELVSILLGRQVGEWAVLVAHK